MRRSLAAARGTCAVLLRSYWDHALGSPFHKVSASTLAGPVAGATCGTRKVGFGRYSGWAYAEVAANDPAYCTWVLETAGSDSSLQLRDFAKYLTAARHGHRQDNVGVEIGESAGVQRIGFGRYLGWTFAKVSMKHPEYCAWVLKEAGPGSSAPLRDFAAYLSLAKRDVADKIEVVPSASCLQVDRRRLDDLVCTLRAIVKSKACAGPVGFIKLAEITRLFGEICCLLHMSHVLRPFHISQVAWAAAKLQFYSEDLFNTLASAMLLKIGEFQALDLATTGWAFASVGWSDVEVFSALAAAAVFKIDSCCEHSIAMIAWAFAKVGRSDAELFSALAAATAARVDCLSEQGVSISAWAFATIGRSDAELFSSLAAAAVARIASFKPQGIANTAWAFAKAGRSDAQLFSALAVAAIAKIDSFTEQNLANTAWAFATIGRSDADLFSHVAAAAVAKIDSFKAQGIANIAWAFAKAGRSDAQLFLALDAAAVAKIDSFNEQNIANTAWAFATAGKSDAELFSSLAAMAGPKICSFSPQEIANIAWAFVKIDNSDEQLFSVVAAAALAKIDSFNEMEIASTAWAFATIGRSDAELFSSLAAAAVARIDSFKPQGVANTAWAFAKAGRSDAQLFSALAAAAVSDLDRFHEQEIANIAWAFAKIGTNDEQLFSALAAASVARIDAFNPQEIALIAWAFAKLGRSDSMLFSRLAAAALCFMSEKKLMGEHGLDQISWAFVHADLPPSPLYEALLAEIVRYASNQGWAQLSHEVGPAMSKIEGACAEIVSGLLPHALTSRNRYLLGFELDIVVEDNNRLVNLEIDGPRHDDLRQQCIDTRRDAFLQRLGVRVVRVDLKAVGSQFTNLEDALVAALLDAGLDIS